MALSMVALLSACGPAEEPPAVANQDYSANAQRWAAEEFQPSTLAPETQLAELAWFTQAAEGLRGLSINVVSEALTTHEYESTVLAEAFF